MLAVPPVILEMLDMDSGSSVSMSVDSGKLVIEPEKHKKYTLDSLLAQCNPDIPISSEDMMWVTDGGKGEELL